MKNISRRNFVKMAGMATAALSVSGLLGVATGCAKEGGPSSIPC